MGEVLGPPFRLPESTLEGGPSAPPIVPYNLHLPSITPVFSTSEMKLTPPPNLLGNLTHDDEPK